jgi:hypothetical protein
MLKLVFYFSRDGVPFTLNNKAQLFYSLSEQIILHLFSTLPKSWRTVLFSIEEIYDYHFKRSLVAQCKMLDNNSRGQCFKSCIRRIVPSLTSYNNSMVCSLYMAFIFLSECPSVCLSAHLPACLSFCLSICLPSCLLTCLSAKLPFFLS